MNSLEEKQYTEGGVYGQPNEELLQLAWAI